MLQWLVNLHLLAMSPMEPGTCDTDLSVEKIEEQGGGMGVKNDPKAKQRKQPPGNAVLSTCC